MQLIDPSALTAEIEAASLASASAKDTSAQGIAAVVHAIVAHLAKRTGAEFARFGRINGALAECVEATPNRLAAIEARLLEVERRR